MPAPPRREHGNLHLNPLLDLRDLRIEFGHGSSAARAVDGVSLTLHRGETLALVGESGSGKTLTALAIARLIPTPPARYAGGEIWLDGRDLRTLSETELRTVRGAVVSYVFQEPGAALNPCLRIGTQILESLRLHRPDVATEAEVVRLLQLVGLPAPALRARSFPHEVSGGMQQRVVLAMALASQPKLLVADEPTTALDVTVQAQVIELLGELRRQSALAILLITHNLGIVGDLADRVAVMYAGQVVESAPADALLRRPLHPYTRALMQSVPRLDTQSERLLSIPGAVPRPGEFPTGCRFHPRCPQARPECATAAPELLEVAPGRSVRCPFWDAATSTPSRP